VNIVLYSPKSNKLKLYTPSKVFNFERKNQDIQSWLTGSDVLMIDKTSRMSKIEFFEWINMSSFFEDFPTLTIDIAIEIPIVFYDVSNNYVRLCDPENGISTHKLSSKRLSSKLPDYFAYVEAAHLMTKKQFAEWLSSGKIENVQKIGKEEIIDEIITNSKQSKKYIHTVNDGTVLVEDIKVNDGILRLNGRWHFVPVDTIGEDVLDSSTNYQILLKKGKVEVVDQQYYDANKHKYKPTTSLMSTLPVGSVDDFLKEDSDIPVIEIN